MAASDVHPDLTELLRAERRFRAAVESSPSGMVMVDADGVITLVNREVERLFGYSREELLGSKIEKLIPPRYRAGHPEFRIAFRAHPETRPMGAGRELFGQRKDGSEVPVEIGLTPVSTEDGLFVIAAIVDVSLRKHAEALRDESRHKDQFLAVLSHELRGPLASLRICVNLIESKVTAGGRFREAVEIADRQLEHLASLVDQLLDASRIATGKFVLDRKVLNLVDIVRTSAEDQRHVLESQDVQFTVQLPAEPLWINGDALRLSQIVVNLLGNSAKFSPKGGRATLTLAPDEGGQLAVLTVKDEGAGIEPDVLPLVFRPFTRVDPADAGEYGGLGLGLALVQSLAQAHGGSAEARSEGRGRGAELIVRLPLVREPAPDVSSSISSQASRAAATRRRILVVEDNRDTARSLGWSLEAHGHEVAVAPEGRTALETMRTFHPDVVLCDIGLPGGMDGYAVARAIRGDSAGGAPYLIAVTGYGMPADKVQAQEAGFDQFFVKGRDPRALLDLIDQMPRP
ncbi:MAG TPA: PAS domain S-box protein [Gemmatimonadales bacterium]|nr:PAS domain S-box protein [Gemmatimonadales bacterium]